MCGKAYEAVQDRKINRLLLRSGVITIVACDREDPDLLFGFACFEPEAREPVGHRGILHYVFVRPELRGRGIATRLLLGVEFNRTSHPWKDYPCDPRRAW